MVPLPPNANSTDPDLRTQELAVAQQERPTQRVAPQAGPDSDYMRVLTTNPVTGSPECFYVRQQRGDDVLLLATPGCVLLGDKMLL